MVVLNGKVLARRKADEIWFLVTGHVTSRHSPALRQYAEDGVAGGVTKIQVDLRECTYCDSTFLGTLLHLKRWCDAAACVALRLVSPSVQFRQMMKQIGAERLFSIVEQALPADDVTWQELEDDLNRVGAFCFKKNIVEAHQALADAGGQLGERFASLAEAVSRELEAEHGQQAESRPS